MYIVLNLCTFPFHFEIDFVIFYYNGDSGVAAARGIF